MKKYFSLVLLIIGTQFLFAQKRTVLEISQSILPYESIAAPRNIDIPVADQEIDFTTFAVRTANFEIALSYRTMDSNDSLSNWKALPRNSHFRATDKNWVSRLIFLPNETISIQLKLLKATTENDKVEIIYYQEFVEDKINPAETTPTQRTACPCPQPDFLNRAAWCPAGDCTPHPNPSPTTVTHIIVHHAASTNASSNWSGVVRSIWDFHVNSNGWDDIGYNWLIDPEGVVYEGRGDNIRGAHFCGTNSNTLGICMLGDFQLEEPQSLALEKLKTFLAWKTCDIAVDPEEIAFHSSSGLQLNRIAGHRQGCNTECPGDAFFPLFSTLREDVNTFREESCDVFLAPSALVATFEDDKINLQWTDNSSNEMNFLLERAEWSTSNYEMLTELSANNTNYMDESIEFNSAYFYRIRAVNNNDTTAYSNEVGIATVIASQNNLTLSGIKIFPNPTSDFLNITSTIDNLTEIHFINMQGQLVWSRKNIQQDKLQVDLQALEAGIYLLQIVTEAGVTYENIQLLSFH